MRNKNINKADPNSFVTSSGERFHVIFEPKVNPDGTIDLVECGRDDIQEMIDSYLEQTDMAIILKRLEMGDESVLNKDTPMYGDFTQMPKTYAEALQMVIDAENTFYTLPIDVRNQFENDYRQWFAQAGSDDWYTKMGYKVETEKEDIKEVAENES